MNPNNNFIGNKRVRDEFTKRMCNGNVPTPKNEFFGKFFKSINNQAPKIEEESQEKGMIKKLNELVKDNFYSSQVEKDDDILSAITNEYEKNEETKMVTPTKKAASEEYDELLVPQTPVKTNRMNEPRSKTEEEERFERIEKVKKNWNLLFGQFNN